MDSPTKGSITAAYDQPDNLGRIVRNIAEIEHDHHLVSGPLSERMMFEAVKGIRSVVAEPARVIESDWTAIIQIPAWKMLRGVGVGDAWLELTEIGADDEREYSWISAATGAGPTRMGIELAFRPGLLDAAQAVIRKDKMLEALWKLNWVRDETDARLFLPITISIELLAKGFEENDLAKALAPVSEAMAAALAAQPELDKVVGQVRSPK